MIIGAFKAVPHNNRMHLERPTIQFGMKRIYYVVLSSLP